MKYEMKAIFQSYPFLLASDSVILIALTKTEKDKTTLMPAVMN